MLKIKKAIFISILAFIITLSPLAAPTSHAWMAIPSQIMKQAMEEVSKRIEGITLSMLQQQAMKMLNKQMEKLVGGGSGSSAKFITDWKKVLETDPKSITKTFINSGIDSALNGKGSISQYISSSSLSGLVKSASDDKTKGQVQGSSISEGFGSLLSLSSSSGSGGSYASQLSEMAKKATTEYEAPVFDFEGEPAEVLSDGTFKKLGNLLDEKKINTASGFVNYWSKQYDAKLASEKKIAQTKAVAYQGFIGTGDKGDGKSTITNPGILIKEAMANVQDIGNKIIAGATHPEQIISAVVSQMISQSIEKGIGEMSKMVDKQISQVTDKATSAINSAVSSSGPGAAFGNSSTKTTTNSTSSK